MTFIDTSTLKKPLKLPLKDADVWYYPQFFSEKKAHTIMQSLLSNTPWQEDDIKIFGKIYKQPRLTALYGENGKEYRYSGITMYPEPFTPLLLEIKEAIEQIAVERFNVVLCNLYRNGSDSNGWHSDNEKELGKKPYIASVSFGAKRSFQFKHNTIKEERFKIDLENGSLLLMGNTTQQYYKHQIPKTKKDVATRINLTFRKIID